MQLEDLQFWFHEFGSCISGRYVFAAGRNEIFRSLFTNCGGKGLNQSIAAAKAGNQVVHAGVIGSGGEMLEEVMAKNGVDVSLLSHVDAPSGHAIIQVDDAGQNCILLFGGTNQMLTEAYITEVLDKMDADTLVLLQNETNLVGFIMEEAHKEV